MWQKVLGNLSDIVVFSSSPNGDGGDGGVDSMVMVMVFNLEEAGSQDKARVCRSTFGAGARSENNSE